MKSDNPVWDGICFHAQQCAEKYLKAVLEEQDEDIPRIHDLVVLLDQAENDGESLGPVRSDLARLSTFGVATRYPGMDADAKAAREALETAERVRRAVRERFELP